MRISDWSSDVCSSDLASLFTTAPSSSARSASSTISESQAEVSRNKGTHSHMAGLALRVFQWSAIWFTGNPVAVAVHAVTISWLTAVNWSGAGGARIIARSDEHTSELQSLMRISYAVFCLKK